MKISYEDYYYYAIKAVDRVGNISGFSSVASGFQRFIASGDIGEDAITALQLADLAVDNNHIAVNAIRGNVISAAAITREKLLDGVVTSGVIAPSSIIANNIKAGAIETEKIAASAIVAAKIEAGAITTNKIGADQVIGTHILAGEITAAHIEAGAITTTHLSASAVTAGKISADAIFLGLSVEDIELHLPFEDDQGEDYAHDYSGTAISGAFDGSGASAPAVWTTSGKFGSGADFTPHSGSKINLSSTITLTGAWTVSGWFNIVGYGGTPGICGHATAYANGRIAFATDAQGIQIYTVGDTQLCGINTTFPTATWFHLVITRDGSNNIKIYMDGEDVTGASQTATGNILVQRIGDNPYDSGWTNLNGYLDEFKLWNRQVSGDDIKSLYRLGAVPNTYTRITQGMIEADAIKGRHIDADVITANHIFAGTITKTETDGTIALTDGTRSITIYPTGSLPAAAGWAGKHVYLTSDDIVYFSDGVNWVPTDVSKAWDDAYTSDRKLTHVPLSDSWWGMGTDGDLQTSGDVLLTTPVKMYENLTVDAGDKLYTELGSLIIYVHASCVINGTIEVGYSAPGGSGAMYANGGGRGGDAGGVLMIFAKNLHGSGSIIADGSGGNLGKSGYEGISGIDGETGEDGWVGQFEGNSFDAPTGGTGAEYNQSEGNGLGGLGSPPAWELSTFAVQYAYNAGLTGMPILYGHGSTGGGGGGGGLGTASSWIPGGGGGGGGGLWGAGGDGGDGEQYTGGAPGDNGGGGAGGGGAGGIIVTVTTNLGNALDAYVRGGAGGVGGVGNDPQYSGDGGGGGGGGGGMIINIADSDNLGGSASGGAGGYSDSGSNGSAGEAGNEFFFRIDDFLVAQS